ncbi:hypothetical protein Tco_0345797 [Tanacetum coccineum]
MMSLSNINPYPVVGHHYSLIVTVAKHRTVTLLPTSVVRPSGELSASIEREFVGDASVGDGGDQGVASVGGQDNVEPIVPITDNVETEIPGPKRTKKKRVTRGSERTPAASHPPKRLRADYGTTGGSATGGKSPSVLNRLLQDSRLMVEQGVPALPTLPFITSSVTASPLEEGGDHTDSVTGPSLRTVGPSARFVVLSDSSHHSGAKSADPEVDSLVRSVAPVMTTATTVTAFVSSVAATAPTAIDAGKNKDVPAPSVFAGSSSSDRTDRTLSLFTGRSGSEFAAGSIRAGENADVNLQEVYVPEWSVIGGFELNDGRSCANMIDHFTPPAFFKTVRGMEHEQLFAEFNVSAARNLSLSSEVRMRAEYNILEKRRWKSLAEEKDNLLQVKDKEIEDLRSQLLQAKVESMEVARLHTRVSSLEAIEGSLRGEVASAKEHNGLLEQECGSLKLKVTSLESIIAEKDRELSDLGASSSSLRSQNQSLVNQVNELETSSTDLRGKLEMYEGSMKQLEEFQDNLMKPLEARLAEIDADFTRCCMHFQENFHPHLLNAIAGRRWLLTHGMKLLMAKSYNPSAEADFNSVVHDLRGLDFSLLQELFAKKDASTWDVMDLLRLDDAVAEVLGMTDLQPDAGQLMVPVHHKQDKVVIGSQALFVALETYHRRVQKMERNLVERLPLLRYVFVSIDHPVSTEALAILPEDVYEPWLYRMGPPTWALELPDISLPACLVATDIRIACLNLGSELWLCSTFPLSHALCLCYIHVYFRCFERGHSDLRRDDSFRSVSQGERSISVTGFDHGSVRPKDMRDFFYPVLVVLAQPCFYSLTQTPVCSSNQACFRLGFVHLAFWHALSSALRPQHCWPFACEGPTHRSHGPRKDFLYSIPLMMAKRYDLRFIALAFFLSAGKVSSVRIFLSIHHHTPCLLECAKLVDAILLSASAFLFLLLGTCFIKNARKVLASAFTFSKYLIMSVYFTM